MRRRPHILCWLLLLVPTAAFADGVMDHEFDDIANWQGVVALSLSPDARRMAVLFRYADAVA